MNKSPSFQFYAQDFLTGVVYLTNEEIGIYIKMLCKQWTDGKIPKKRLGLLVGLEWENFSEELKDKFIDDGDFLTNKRLELEREKKKTFLKKQAENGKKGGRPPKKENKSKPLINPNESQKKPLEDEDEKEEEIEKEIEEEVEKEKSQKIEFQKIVDIFNSVCKNLPNVQKVTKQRQASINARVSEYGLGKIGEVFQSVSGNEFLNGNNDRGWKADFDWIMNPNNFIKILEGKYQQNGKSNQQTTNSQGGASPEYRRKVAERLGIIQSE